MLAFTLLLSATAASTGAFARERLAVLVVAESDSLTDNLTEIAIAHLALRDSWTLVGLPELRARLSEVVPKDGLDRCLEQPACARSLLSLARAKRAIIIEVQTAVGERKLSMSLVDLRTEAPGHRFSRSVPVEARAQLIAAIREGLDDLFIARDPAPPATQVAPVVAKPIEPVVVPAPAPTIAPAPAVSLIGPRPPDLTLSSRRTWWPYLAIGASAAAMAAFSVAAVYGTRANQALSGDDRMAMQSDLKGHQSDATTANVLFGASAVTAAIAGAAFYRWWRGQRR